MSLFGLVLGTGFFLSWFRGLTLLFLPVLLNFVIWTVLGFVLSAMALWMGVRERIGSELTT